MREKAGGAYKGHSNSLFVPQNYLEPEDIHPGCFEWQH